MVIVFIGIAFVVAVFWILLSGSGGNERNFDKENREKGFELEEKVYQSVKNHAVEEGRYERYIRNAYVPLSDGNTTEIDLIVVNEKGISAFESKYRDGTIGNVFTDPKAEYWDCVHYSSDRRVQTHYKIYNPIKQNYHHIYALKKFLEKNRVLLPKRTRNYVVFGGDVSIGRTIFNCRYDGRVYRYSSDVGKYFSDDQKYNVREISYSKKQIDEVADFIEKNCCNVSPNIKKKHIKYVASKVRASS